MSSSGEIRGEVDSKEDGVAAYSFSGHKEEVYHIASSPTDVTLVASGDETGTFMWKLGSEEDKFKMADTPNSKLAFSFDGALLACGTQNVQIWNVATKTLQGTLQAPKHIDWVKWHPQGPVIIAGVSKKIWMWNANRNHILNIFCGHQDTVNCGDFTPDGKLICTGSCDSSLRIWDPKTAECKHVLKGRGFHTMDLNCLSISLDSQRIVSGSADGSVHIVELESGKAIRPLHGFPKGHSVEDIGFSLGYNRVAAGSLDGNVIIWNLDTGSKVTCEHNGKVTALAWLGLSRYVASGCLDGKVRIWDSDIGKCVQTFSSRHSNESSINFAVSANNNFLICSSGCYVLVYDISVFK